MINSERKERGLTSLKPNKRKILERKRTKLTKDLLDAANKTNFMRFRMDSNPRMRRLKYMRLVEEIENIFSMFEATKNIL